MTFQVHNNGFTVSVQNGGEYANFHVLESSNVRQDKTYHACTLTIDSSCGTMGHTWTSMGMSAKQFFEKIGEDYLLGKLYGSELDRFDFDETIKAMKTEILAERRKDWLDKDEARELFDEIIDLEQTTSTEYFISQAQGKEAISERWDHIYFPIQTRTRGDALRFWELLWPEFLQGLNYHWHHGVPENSEKI